jgi:hypothetical protein
MTGAKTSNLPLLLPWAIAILPARGLIKRRILQTMAVCVVAVLASFLPTAILNAHFCGDWTGWKAEGTPQRNAPLLRVPANAVLITIQNLTPPAFPFANTWNRYTQQIMPAGLSQRSHEAVVEPKAVEFHTEELQIEDSAGLGFGVTGLIFISMVFVAIHCSGPFLGLQFASAKAVWCTGVRLAPWISLLALLSQSEVYPLGRILAPYYALLLPLLLAGPAPEQPVKKIWWRAAAFTIFVIAAALLIISPARPLFPVGMFLEKIHKAAAQHPALARVETVYSVYRERNDAFAPARASLPPDLKVLGLVAYDDPETSLWRPFGSRRIEHVCPQDTVADLKARGVEYILVKTGCYGFIYSPEDWAKRMDAQVIQRIPLRLRAAAPATDWYLVKVPEAPGSSK